MAAPSEAVLPQISTQKRVHSSIHARPSGRASDSPWPSPIGAALPGRTTSVIVPPTDSNATTPGEGVWAIQLAAAWPQAPGDTRTSESPDAVGAGRPRGLVVVGRFVFQQPRDEVRLLGRWSVGPLELHLFTAVGKPTQVRPDQHRRRGRRVMTLERRPGDRVGRVERHDDERRERAEPRARGEVEIDALAEPPVRQVDFRGRRVVDLDELQVGNREVSRPGCSAVR